MKIADREVGPGHPVFVIAEIGVNHNGKMELATELVDMAADAGADAVKFQKRTPDLLGVKSWMDESLDEGFGVMSQYDQRVMLELSVEELAWLKARAEDRGLVFFASPWDVPSLYDLEGLNVPCHKVASASLNNEPLLQEMARTGKPLIVSTGMADEVLVDRAVEFLVRQRGCTSAHYANIALLQCTSTYPSEYKDLQLRAIPYMQKRYEAPVGYSGHEPGIHIPVAAVAMGACIIEKHVTIDRTMTGADHAASLEPAGFERMIRNIRDVESAMGVVGKDFHPSEIPVERKLRMSIASARHIARGEVIAGSMLTVRGPGTGMSPAMIDELIGKQALVDIDADTIIDKDLIKWD